MNNINSKSLTAARRHASCAGYLGPDATFSHQAATILYSDETILKGAETIEDIFLMVVSGECEEGVVPIENSYEGAVNITQDLLNRYDANICNEFYLRVRQNLLSREKDIKDITRVYSHPQAIAQCRLWIKENLPGAAISQVSSTALAARMTTVEPKTAAIGSSFAASKYDLNVLYENIEDDPSNVTRFFVIGNNISPPTGRDKTSIIFFLQHKPGSLYKCLSVLAEMEVNMTRIESRPAKTKKWEYLFFVDLEGHAEDKKVDEALREMEKHCVFLKVLGSYPGGVMPEGS